MCFVCIFDWIGLDIIEWSRCTFIHFFLHLLTLRVTRSYIIATRHIFLITLDSNYLRAYRHKNWEKGEGKEGMEKSTEENISVDFYWENSIVFRYTHICYTLKRSHDFDDIWTLNALKNIISLFLHNLIGLFRIDKQVNWFEQFFLLRMLKIYSPSS